MDNTQINNGLGDSIRDIDRGGVKTQVVQLDAGGPTGESLVSPDNPLPMASQEAATLLLALRALIHSVSIDAASGRVRVMLDANGGAQTLGTVSTVGNVTQFGGLPNNGFIYDQMHAAWGDTVRRAIT